MTLAKKTKVKTRIFRFEIETFLLKTFSQLVKMPNKEFEGKIIVFITNQLKKYTIRELIILTGDFQNSWNKYIKENNKYSNLSHLLRPKDSLPLLNENIN